MDYRDNIDENLIQQAKTDPEAFAKLFRAHYNIVFRYCARRLFDRHSAEDVTSTVFMKVMKNIGSFDGDRKDFINWLIRIATNAVNDHLRSSKRRADAIRIASSEPKDGPALVIDSDHRLQEKKDLLKQALLSLKPKYQTVIALRFFENMKLNQIAACLGKNPATVRSQLSRAIVKLRKKLTRC